MDIKQPENACFRKRHAVVIGASMAGLLAGRVLSDYFERVTLIERDLLPANTQARKGVPQGLHVHGLLNKGASILAEFFPDLFSALLDDGATALDTIEDGLWYHFGLWKARFPSGITGYTQSRPFLEQHVRDCLTARANIHFIDGCEVTRLLTTGDRNRVTGVHLRYRSEERREQELAADLVVDASGRGSQAPQWLASIGYGTVEESCVRVDVGYATRVYRRPDQALLDRKALVIYPKPPYEKRAGYIFPIENGCWIVTLAGWLRDYPPDNEADFLNYARSLPVPPLYEAIKDAEPVTSIFIHKFPANRRRHYERMPRFPEGFIVLGDAACTFNPLYGQGMTTAALEAKTLAASLHQQLRIHADEDLAGFARRFQKTLARVVEVPWLLATSEDFRYPETQGHRPPGIRLFNWYTGRVHALAGSHPLVTLRFYEVIHMLKPPSALLTPRILFAVLFQRHQVPLKREDEAYLSVAPPILDDKKQQNEIR
jgi:2-polyprenyl-6-methoxyphenol hydroxylase-like FAD-dependent oxidoreductase